MSIDRARQSRASKLVRAGGRQGHDDAGGRARFGPQHKDARRALAHLAARCCASGIPGRVAVIALLAGTLIGRLPNASATLAVLLFTRAHGGFLTLLFDDVLGATIRLVDGPSAVTGTLEVK